MFLLSLEGECFYCPLMGRFNTGIRVSFPTVIMPQGALHVGDKSRKMVSAVISCVAAVIILWFQTSRRRAGPHRRRFK